MRATRAIFYKENLINNLSVIKSFLQNKDTKICVAVKANGYGAGAVNVSKTCVEHGASFLAVATVEEGIEIRKANIDIPILLLSVCTPEEIKDVILYKLTPLVFDIEYIELFNEQAKKYSNEKINVHLAIDTGMGRIGCFFDEASSIAKKIANSSKLNLEGICTHFSSADEISNDGRAYTKKQFDNFMKAIKLIEDENIDVGIRHCCASAALLDNKDMQLDMVRPGIITYGYFDGDVNKEYFEKQNINCNLQPVMSLESRVVAIKSFKKGSAVSYNRTWQTQKDTNIAVLPIGYADGILRKFSPGLQVTINGKNYNVVGRICMDQCMVDIGNDSNIKRWDKAIFFGPKNSGALQDASHIAKNADTISYEILTSISSRVERVLL